MDAGWHYSCRSSFIIALLTPGERAYVDAYHAEVLAKVGPLLDGEVLDWLKAQTAPLSAIMAFIYE